MIFNPQAGSTDLATPISQVADFWRHRGWQVTIQATKSARHAIELAKTAALSGAQLVFAAGGDGTLGEVANGLVGTETILAPLPFGTANSFAKELRIPIPSLFDRNRLEMCVTALANGKVHRLDLGLDHQEGQNGRYWISWSGVGADAFMINALEPRPKWSKKMGRLGYALQGVSILPQFEGVHAQVVVDGKEIQGDFVLVEITNCRLYAGLIVMNPEARLDDGLFEVWLFRGRGISKTILHLADAFQGKHTADADVVRLQGKTISVSTLDPAPIHADGDHAGFTPFSCEVIPQAVRILVPDTAPADLFSHPGIPLQEALAV